MTIRGEFSAVHDSVLLLENGNAEWAVYVLAVDDIDADSSKYKKSYSPDEQTPELYE